MRAAPLRRHYKRAVFFASPPTGKPSSCRHNRFHLGKLVSFDGRDIAMRPLDIIRAEIGVVNGGRAISAYRNRVSSRAEIAWPDRRHASRNGLIRRPALNHGAHASSAYFNHSFDWREMFTAAIPLLRYATWPLIKLTQIINIGI